MANAVVHLREQGGRGGKRRARPAVAIIAALERELRPAREKIGTEAIYLAMGMGRASVEANLHVFLKEKRPEMAILTGFAGGLQPGLRSGELVLAEGFLRPGGEELSVDRQLWLEARQALDSGGSSPRHGRLVTVEHPASCEAKNRLGKDFPALAVDMESWWAAALAREAGVPFLCLKAILDPLDRALPRFITGVDSAGRPTRRAWLTLVGRPQELRELRWLARAAHQLSAALAQTLARLVEHFAPRMEVDRWGSS